jgi:MarR family 2-MHQ and catechol resistance regulon transcriptional repressor
MNSPTPHTTDDDPLGRDAVDLLEALNDLIRVYQFRDRKRICCHDISVTQCYAMRAIHRDGPLTLGGLAEALYLDNSTASRVVDSLERKGYTQRVPDAADGRVVRLELTPEGEDLYSRIERDLVQQQRELLAEFDPEVRQATARLIARLAREAAARVSREDGACCRT